MSMGLTHSLVVPCKLSSKGEFLMSGQEEKPCRITPTMSCMRLIILLEDSTVGQGMFGILDTMICHIARKRLDSSLQESPSSTQMRMMRFSVCSLLTLVTECVSILTYLASHVLVQRLLNG